MLNGATVAAFKASLRGGLIEPDDPGFDAARKVYNAMIDRRPRPIARCVDVADVITSVELRRVTQAMLRGHPRRRPQCRWPGRVR